MSHRLSESDNCLTSFAGRFPRAGLLDLDVDANILWPLFQRDVADTLGVGLWEIAKEKWLVQDPGAE